MYTIATVLTFAMAASALLTARQIEGQQCGNTGKLSCCAPESNSQAAGGFLGLAGLDSIAGGTCQQIPASIADLPVAGPSICGGNTVYCCEETSSQQTGLINLSTTCSPITL